MPPVCNKCQYGVSAEGDSWCIGCGALEHAQTLLKVQWRNAGVRRIAEESLLSAARLVRAFSQVDAGVEPVRAGEARAPGLSVAAKASSRKARTPSPSRRRERSRSPLPRSDRRRSREAERKEKAEPVPTGDTEESSFEEEEEESRGEKPSSAHRGRERPPEPEGPPPSKPGTHKKKKKGKKVRRGGTRHQRHYRTAEDPFKRTHRPLRGAVLELAPSLARGLERRL
eukprot:Skav213872  [mRNA]  locus=scaffold2374:75304:75984:+ [translate_table: standard]